MKEKYAHLALIGIGAAIVLYFLLRQSQASISAPAEVLSTPVGAPVYPNSQPIKLGDIAIGGSPINITYNQGEPYDPLSKVELQPGVNSATPGGSCSCEDDCAPAGMAVTIQKVPEKVYTIAVDNFSGFVAKRALPAHNAPASSADPLAFSGKVSA